MTLSPRQAQVADLVADGRSDSEIAHEMGVSVDTVRSHLTAVFEKWGAGSRGDVIARVTRQRVIAELAKPRRHKVRVYQDTDLGLVEA